MKPHVEEEDDGRGSCGHLSHDVHTLIYIAFVIGRLPVRAIRTMRPDALSGCPLGFSTAPSSTPGGIILASMRHATREVLGRVYGDAELMQSVAGRVSRRRWRRSRQPHRRARPRLSRAQRAASRPAPRLRTGWTSRSSGCHAGAAARHRERETPVDGGAGAFEHVPIAHLFETVVGGDETTAPSLIRSRCCSRRSACAYDPADAAYVGDSPFDLRAAKAARHARDRRHVGPHPRPRASRGGGPRTSSSTRARLSAL